MPMQDAALYCLTTDPRATPVQKLNLTITAKVFFNPLEQPLCTFSPLKVDLLLMDVIK